MRPSSSTRSRAAFLLMVCSIGAFALTVSASCAAPWPFSWKKKEVVDDDPNGEEAMRPLRKKMFETVRLRLIAFDNILRRKIEDMGTCREFFNSEVLGRTESDDKCRSPSPDLSSINRIPPDPAYQLRRVGGSSFPDGSTTLYQIDVPDTITYNIGHNNGTTTKVDVKVAAWDYTFGYDSRTKKIYYFLGKSHDKNEVYDDMWNQLNVSYQIWIASGSPNRVFKSINEWPAKVRDYTKQMAARIKIDNGLQLCNGDTDRTYKSYKDQRYYEMNCTTALLPAGGITVIFQVLNESIDLDMPFAD